jgi:hypothetical protein
MLTSNKSKHESTRRATSPQRHGMYQVNKHSEYTNGIRRPPAQARMVERSVGAGLLEGAIVVSPQVESQSPYQLRRRAERTNQERNRGKKTKRTSFLCSQLRHKRTRLNRKNAKPTPNQISPSRHVRKCRKRTHSWRPRRRGYHRT